MPWGRRWMIGLVGIVVLLALLSLLTWFVWVPSWRPPLRDRETYGIDVSSHQGEIDWSTVASDNIRFAYIKATEGGDFVDRSFNANWRGAGKAGLNRAPYHFFTLCTPGAVQAEHFLAVAPPQPDALAPALDLELAGNCSRRPTRAEVEVELGSFMAWWSAAGSDRWSSTSATTGTGCTRFEHDWRAPCGNATHFGAPMSKGGSSGRSTAGPTSTASKARLT